MRKKRAPAAKPRPKTRVTSKPRGGSTRTKGKLVAPGKKAGAGAGPRPKRVAAAAGAAPAEPRGADRLAEDARAALKALDGSDADRGRLDAAIALSREALALDPEHFVARYALFYALDHLAEDGEDRAPEERRQLRAWILAHSEGMEDRKRARALALASEAADAAGARDAAELDRALAWIAEAIALRGESTLGLVSIQCDLLLAKAALRRAAGDPAGARPLLVAAALWQIHELVDRRHRFTPVNPRVGPALEDDDLVAELLSTRRLPALPAELGGAAPPVPPEWKLREALLLVCGEGTTFPTKPGEVDPWTPGRRARIAVLVVLGADLRTPGVLHRLGKVNDLAALDLALAQGAPVAAREDGETALFHTAEFDGRGEVIARLLRAGADPRERQGHRGWTVLGWACVSADADTVQALLAGGAPIDAAALHGAAAWGKMDVVECLLAHGADPRTKVDGTTPAQAARRKGHFDVAARLERSTGVEVASTTSIEDLKGLARALGENAARGREDHDEGLEEGDYEAISWDALKHQCESAIAKLDRTANPDLPSDEALLELCCEAFMEAVEGGEPSPPPRSARARRSRAARGGTSRTR
ncbi:MAG TPA: ankyrin repeat domain-containing protein [Anaeromyxobacter sp.]|nr:ankyrin repeat domain-containing protein [Anaeromyxobacter sp.]